MQRPDGPHQRTERHRRGPLLNGLRLGQAPIEQPHCTTDQPVKHKHRSQGIEIRHAGEDCRGFVRRMLEFSKVSCFDSKPTSMGPLIEDTVLMFRQAEDRHHPVDVRLPDAPVVLMVDPILIRHALFNLLQNAAQAAGDDSPIVITLEAAVEPNGTAVGWTLAVSDRGAGIPADVLEKIFIPFFTTRSDGTGLGLPVVQHVVLLHGGHVSATSEPDNGTRFALWLPMAPTSKSA